MHCRNDELVTNIKPIQVTRRLILLVLLTFIWTSVFQDGQEIFIYVHVSFKVLSIIVVSHDPTVWTICPWTVTEANIRYSVTQAESAMLPIP